MSNLTQSLGAISLALLLSACGGGGGNDAGSKNGNGSGSVGSGAPALTDAQIVANLKSSNIDFGPGANGRPAGTWRWPNTPSQHIVVYIPPPAAGNATETDYAAKVANSVTLINARLSGYLVLDVSNTAPASGNYIQVSYSTSWVPPGSTDYNSYCANVSTEPNSGSMIMPDAQNGLYSKPVFLNLGNGHCNVTQDIVTHEFGHALGLANHFYGFGDGPASSPEFFDALATLYGNPPSTVADKLVVKHAKN